MRVREKSAHSLRSFAATNSKLRSPICLAPFSARVPSGHRSLLTATVSPFARSAEPAVPLAQKRARKIGSLTAFVRRNQLETPLAHLVFLEDEHAAVGHVEVDVDFDPHLFVPHGDTGEQFVLLTVV